MPNTFVAEFRNHRMMTGLKSVEIRQKFGNHTLAFLDYEIRDRAKYLLPPERTPGRIRWGNAPLGVKNFYGYHNHYETSPSSGARVMTRLVMVGTSKVMNASNPTTWTGITYSGIAREFARRNRLRSVVHTHPFVLDTWSTGNRSDFLALNAAADEAGYRAWVDGGTVYFLDPSKSMATAQSMFTPVIKGSAVREARVTGGAGAPSDTGAAKHRVVHGLDYTTNELFTATGGDPQNPSTAVGNAVASYAEARQATESASQYDGDTYTIKATVDGDAELYPGGLVYLSGSSQVNTDQEGYWVVSEATHRLDSLDFATEFVATRGSKHSVKNLSKTTLSGVRRQVNCLVRDGTNWEAELQEHINV